MACSKSDEVTETNAGVYGTTKPPTAVATKPSLELQLTHLVGDTLLAYDAWYLNEWGEQFKVDVFKYYLTNLVLIYDSVGRVTILDSYFLVDQSKSASKKITLGKIPLGKLIGVEFLIGVDAIRNYSGNQTGALDPVLGMFWTWNSGYIMAKMEGRYLKGSNPNKQFIWHCGGYQAPYSSIRLVKLNFPLTSIDTMQKTVLAINTNLLEWFKTPNNVKIDSIPVFNDPTLISSKVADNYTDMFSIKEVRKESY